MIEEDEKRLLDEKDEEDYKRLYEEEKKMEELEH
jgi:hypothetical protein